jgi:hypothetical protein
MTVGIFTAIPISSEAIEGCSGKFVESYEDGS